jgi:hypothetical protein
MAASSFMSRKPRAEDAPRFGCTLCRDGGLAPIPGATQTEKYVDLFATNIPCACAAGDQWRREFELRENPPKCACGHRAILCLLSERPVCRQCFGDVLTEYREAMAARVGGYSTPKAWTGWKKPTDFKGLARPEEPAPITEADFAALGRK